jgi:hypothetical protein
MSRTGEQFFCVDEFAPSRRPLLVVMADPSELPKIYQWLVTILTTRAAKVFYQALQKFKHLRVYANA